MCEFIRTPSGWRCQPFDLSLIHIYLNEALQLTDEQLLKNIHAVQQDNEIYQSTSLAKGCLLYTSRCV